MKAETGESLDRGSSFPVEKLSFENSESVRSMDESLSGRFKPKEVWVSENGGRLGRSSNVEGAMEDSEVKGASTLLKMQRSGDGERLRELGSVSDAISNETTRKDKQRLRPNANGLLRDENAAGSDEVSEFLEGDFVWSKIKSHPWWPGRVYSPCNASEHAKKVRQGDKILVAYFGDGTFAWCSPSQLKPLEDDFDVMVKQSNSKHFVHAIDSLLHELGIVISMNMACSCVLKGQSAGYGEVLAENAGVREGTLIPQRGVDIFSFDSLTPLDCVSLLRNFAQQACFDNFLELTVLKSWLSVFYQWCGGHQLPSYHDPLSIPGLDEDLMEVGDCSNGEEGKLLKDEVGQMSSPWHPRSLLQKFHEVPEDHQYQKRKQKSLAEIIGETINVDDKKVLKTRDQKENMIGEEDEKRSELNESVNVTISNLLKGQSLKHGKRKGVEEDGETVETPRQRKKSKYLSAPYMSVGLGQTKDLSLKEDEVNFSCNDAPQDQVEKDFFMVSSDGNGGEMKEKVEGIKVMFEASNGERTQIWKDNLVNELEGLLKMVREMEVSPS